MLSEVLRGEACKWCGRDLARSYLARLTVGIEKGDTILHPVLCICGGITVIGAGSFVSHMDEVTGEEGRRG